jgi:hypothetical protein
MDKGKIIEKIGTGFIIIGMFLLIASPHKQSWGWLIADGSLLIGWILVIISNIMRKEKTSALILILALLLCIIGQVAKPFSLLNGMLDPAALIGVILIILLVVVLLGKRKA